jgi:hypothetical protein
MTVRVMDAAVVRRAAAVGLLLSALCTVPSPAQLVVTRNLLPTPPADTVGGVGFFPRSLFFAELQRGFGSAGDEHSWSLKIGGILELYRPSARTSLVATVGHELTANPFNSIGFNPRGVVWEENLRLVRRGESFDWFAGAFHRCRHEVDNARPPSDHDPIEGYTPTARLLSLTGVGVGFTTRERPVGDRSTVRAFVVADYYLAPTDNRTPRNSIAPFWRSALGGMRAGFRLVRHMTPSHAFHARAAASTMFLNRDRESARVAVYGDARLELGVRTAGRGGGVEFFAAAERWFDDLSVPIPRSTSLIAIGTRIGGAGF